jgi:predicted transcriptional regulator
MKNILITSKYDKEYSVFFGATSSVVEALERGVKVIHISFDPAFEVYSNKLWENIHIKKIDEHIFEYSLNKKNQLIQFNKNEIMLKKYLKV